MVLHITTESQKTAMGSAVEGGSKPATQTHKGVNHLSGPLLDLIMEPVETCDCTKTLVLQVFVLL